MEGPSRTKLERGRNECKNAQKEREKSENKDERRNGNGILPPAMKFLSHFCSKECKKPLSPIHDKKGVKKGEKENINIYYCI